MTYEKKLIPLLLLAAAPAWAGHAKKAVEIYSATESEPVSVSRNAPRPINPSARKKMNSPTPAVEIAAMQSAAPSNQAAGQAAPDQFAPVSPSIPAYDPVPRDQVNSIVKRIKLVEALLVRHGRAYDYRMHTVKSLERTLAELDATQAPAAKTNTEVKIETKKVDEAAPISELPVPSEADEEESPDVEL